MNLQKQINYLFYIVLFHGGFLKISVIKIRLNAIN